MIVRTRRARDLLSRPDDYVRHFRTNLVAELRSVDGFLDATLVRQVRPDVPRHQPLAVTRCHWRYRWRRDRQSHCRARGDSGA